jgi:hypothetical protein
MHLPVTDSPEREDAAGWQAGIALLELELQRLKGELGEVCNPALTQRLEWRRRETQLELQSAKRAVAACSRGAAL